MKTKDNTLLIAIAVIAIGMLIIMFCGQSAPDSFVHKLYTGIPYLFNYGSLN